MIFYSTGLTSATRKTYNVIGKIFTVFKLPFHFIRRKKESNGVVSYIERSVKEGDVVFNIGVKEDHYLCIIRRKLGKSGRIIAFESRPYLLKQLANRKKILRWKNVELETLILSDFSYSRTAYNYSGTSFQNSSTGAIIINLKDDERDYVRHKINIDTLDNYCDNNNIHPSFLKIDAGGAELEILKGAINVLKTYKPKILLKCEERLAGAIKVMETFEYLRQLDYSGCFVLDTIRIPIVNFDFNLYQNAHNNFYCNNFMFE